MNALQRPYFAHAVNSYNSPLERSWVLLISDYFGITKEDVENPNQPHHQVGYEEYAKRPRAADINHKGMSYFYDEVLPLCDGCVAMPFLDGRMGLGVAGEVNWFIAKNMPTFVIYADEKITPYNLAQFVANRRSGLFNLRLLTDEEKKLITANDPALVVPHLETRLRTYYVYGKLQRPFEIAHLAHMPLPEGFYPEKK